jgi:ribosomal protein S18 acetylase RimI-like enzyme
MPAYRFCRTDDIPALVVAWNACYRPHFPDEPELTEERFKKAAREIGLSTGSSMLATENGEPVALLLAAKREEASFVQAIAVRPGHERRGHGRHLVDSLRRKSAILGPSKILAEVPLDRQPAVSFFAACGFIPETLYGDYRLEAPSPRDPALAPGLAVPVRFEELEEAGCFARASSCSWERSPATLGKLRGELEGRAIFSERRIEAWVLARRGSGPAELASFGHAGDPDAIALLGFLFHDLAREKTGGLRLHKVSEDELSPAVLESWGFRRVRTYRRFAATASAG